MTRGFQNVTNVEAHDTVDILGTYSKQQGRGESTISLMREAAGCRRDDVRGEKPTGIRNAVRTRVKTLTPSEIDQLVKA